MPIEKDANYSGSVPKVFTTPIDKGPGESLIASLNSLGTTGELGSRSHTPTTTFKRVAERTGK